MFGRSMFTYLLLLAFSVGCATSRNDKENPEYERLNSSTAKTVKSTVPNDFRKIKDIPQFRDSDHHMAPGFVFALSHPTDSKLQGRFRSQADGLLKLPYGVTVNVKGLTFAELKQKVLAGYNSFFQKGAQNVSFSLFSKAYWVEVRGFVKKSGNYLVKRKESIDKIIDMAGGLAGNMKKDFFTVSIQQNDMSYTVSLNQYYENNVLGTSFTWTGGDVIFINIANEDTTTQIAPIVEIIGGVLEPGKTFYKENASIFYYISKRGGVISNVGYDEAYLYRKGPKGLERIHFNLTKIDTIPVIKPGDTIMLNAERASDWDKIWLRITQVGSILTTIAFLILAF